MLAGFAADARTIYTCFRPEVLGSASSSDPAALAKATRNDPWDGRLSREQAFVEKLKTAAPHSEIKDLDPILDLLRGTKSPREIVIIREATRIAGLGIIEAMRDCRPGLYEYELQADAEFVFKKAGAYGPAYFALVATGTNTYYSHYHKGTAKLLDGDLVQFDYAPDFKNYTSDVTRVFPVNGKFTPRQVEYYNIYLRLYQALMTSIQVHAEPREIIKRAVVKMDQIVASYPFTDEDIKQAAIAFVERYRKSRANALGHTVGPPTNRCSISESMDGGPIRATGWMRPLASRAIGCTTKAARCIVRISAFMLSTATGMPGCNGLRHSSGRAISSLKKSL